MPGEFKRAARKAERNRKENAVRENAPSQHAPEKRISGLKKYFTLGLFGLAALTMKGHEQERFTERARNEALEIYLHKHEESAMLRGRQRLLEHLRKANPRKSILFLEYYDVPYYSNTRFQEWTRDINNPEILKRVARDEINFIKGYKNYADILADFVEHGGRIHFVEKKTREENLQYESFLSKQKKALQRMQKLIPGFLGNRISISQLMDAFKEYREETNRFSEFREKIMEETIIEAADENPERNSLMLLIGSWHDEVAERTRRMGIKTTLLRERERMPKTFLEQFMERLNEREVMGNSYYSLREGDKQLMREAFIVEGIEQMVSAYSKEIRIQE